MFVQTRRLSVLSKNKLADLQNKLSENVLSSYNQLKGSLFQAMAHRMNAKDKAEMIQYWGDDVALIEGKEEKQSSNAQLHPLPPLPLPTPKFDFDKVIEDTNLFHPVLGEKLADLGYKTLYLTNVRSLAGAPIWKKQRILRPERSQLIANDKVKNNLGSSLSGSISFFMDKKTKEIGIIDGQHRAGALMILAQRGHWDEKVRNILIEVFHTSSQTQVGALFREINAAEPVRLVDLLMQEEAPSSDGSTIISATSPINQNQQVDSKMPPVEVNSSTSEVTEVDGAEAEMKSNAATVVAILDSATDSLATSYPDMFKPSSRCKPPHLNVDVLRDDLFQSDFLSRHDVRTPADLLALLDRVNGTLKVQYQQQQQQGNDPQPSKSAITALKKATEYGFYLGLDKAWMYVTYPPVAAAPKPRGNRKVKQ